MSWFPGRSQESENYINKQKRKQIESLREQIPEVVEIVRDEHYSVSTTTNGITVTLNIYLPKRFPLVAPEVTVSPAVIHPWVNHEMVVDASPLIKNFAVHSKLGRAIEQILRELQEQPPQLMAVSPHLSSTPHLFTGVNSTTPVYESISSFSSSTSAFPSSITNMSSTQLSREGASRYQCPPIPKDFPKVKEMTNEELKKLADQDNPASAVVLNDIVTELDAVKKMQVDRDNLIQDNEDQAAINLSHEPELQEGWTALQEKYLKLEFLLENHRKLVLQQRQLVEKYQLGSVTARLKSLAHEMDLKSEMLAEEFLESKQQVTEFIQTYKQQRKLHHLRKTKYEKLVKGK